MRKFKFASKAVVGMMAVALTMGSFSGAATMKPIGVYAADVESENFEISDIQEDENEEVLHCRGAVFTLQVTALENKTLPTGTYTWESSDETIATVVADTTDTTKATVTILNTAAFDTTVKITASWSDGTDTEYAEYPFEVYAAEVPFTTTEGATTATIKPGDTLGFTLAYTPNSNEVIVYEAGSVDGDKKWSDISGVEISDEGLLSVDGTVPENTVITVTATAYEKKEDGTADEEKIVAYAENDCTITVKNDAAPSTPTDFSKIEINYNTMTLTLNSNAPYVVLEVVKDKTKSPVKLSGTYTYKVDKGKVEIDLGFISLKKDTDIYIYESTFTGTKDYTNGCITLKQQPGKLKLKVDTSKEKFVDAIATNAKEGSNALTINDDEMKKLEYRSQYGTTWEDLDKFPYAAAKVSGTTIYVRRKANGQPAGPETKLKINAAAKAPTVKVNYDKDTVGVKKSGQAMAILGTTAPSDGDWAEPSANNLEIDDIIKECLKKKNGTDPTDAEVAALRKTGFTLVVVTRKAGKADSVPQLVPIKGQESLDTSADNVATYNGKTITLVAGTKDTTKVKLDGDVASFEYLNGSKWTKCTTKEISLPEGGLTVRYVGSKEAGKEAFPTAEKKLTLVAAAKATMTASVTDPTLFVEGANSTAAFTLPLTITVKDADGKTVENPTITATVKDKDDKEVTGITVNGTSLVFGAANDSDATKKGPALVENDTYSVTLSCKVGDDTVTAELNLKVAEKAAETLVPANVAVTEADGTTSTKTVTKPVDTTNVDVTLKATVTTEDGTEITSAEVEYALDDDSVADTGVSIANGVVTITKDATVTTVTVTATVKGTSVTGTFVITIE